MSATAVVRVEKSLEQPVLRKLRVDCSEYEALDHLRVAWIFILHIAVPHPVRHLCGEGFSSSLRRSVQSLPIVSLFQNYRTSEIRRLRGVEDLNIRVSLFRRHRSDQFDHLIFPDLALRCRSSARVQPKFYANPHGRIASRSV